MLGMRGGREQLVAQCAGLANVHLMDLLPLLFSEALLQLAQAPDTRYQLGESACHYAETHLHVDAVLGRFVARLEQELLLN